MPAAATTTVQQTLTVTQLTAQIKGSLEGAFPNVWVTGEISNFSRPQSGHAYFTLKDDQAQIRAVMWRSAAARLKLEMTDGLDVICRGHLDVYAPRGSYQLVVDELQPKGMGALELALRKLREKLSAEGLFDPARKRALPTFPRRVAFVTSPTGAAVHDFLQVLRRRWRGVEVLIIPTRVQGDGAAQEISNGIRLANRIKPPLDVLVVGRGGGSLEDLWSFNDEVVVRAIAASRIPTVSAVGHEIDVTLSDLAADVRALTPSEAAERIAPAADEIRARVRAYQQRLRHAAQRRVAWLRARFDGVATQRPFRRPFDLVHERSRRLDELEVHGQRSMHRIIHDRESRLARLAGKIESLSPLAVLARGYTITQNTANQTVVREASQLKAGQSILTRFARGQVVSTVERIEIENADD
ncbi:MAG TPA: exodeoxyribonuclease VII large subunit [Lacipirellulaceae bacterium]|nr:exodeoxyribonuclease VII large subunit [Lacipirellulaceae bacterium]